MRTTGFARAKTAGCFTGKSTSGWPTGSGKARDERRGAPFGRAGSRFPAGRGLTDESAGCNTHKVRQRRPPSPPTREERARERRAVSIGFPLSLALSPLLRRGEREFTVVCGGRI